MKYLTTIILAYLLASCSTQTIKMTNNNLQEKWELISINGEEVSTQKPITLDFDKNNHWSAYLGCNQINGTYSVTQEKEITIDHIASTKMLCDDKAMNLENTILEALENKDKIKIVADELLVQSENTKLTFKHIQNAEVVGRYWKLIELNGEQVNFSPNQQREQSLTLRSDHKLHGFTGCNYVNGSYSLGNNHHISFDKNLATTMMACEDIDQNAYLEMLQNSNRFKVSSNKFYLYNDSQLLAVFEAVEF